MPRRVQRRTPKQTVRTTGRVSLTATRPPPGVLRTPYLVHFHPDMSNYSMHGPKKNSMTTAEGLFAQRRPHP